MRVKTSNTPPALSPTLSTDAAASMRYARLVFGIIAVVSALTLLVAVVLRAVQPDQVTWVVWVRAGFYTLGGLWLLSLARTCLTTASRSAFVRIRLISILAPLGILALVIAPDSGYPVWMKVEQAIFGVLLVPLAVMLFRPGVSASFPRAQAART